MGGKARAPPRFQVLGLSCGHSSRSRGADKTERVHRPWITHQAAFEDMIGVFPSWTKPETGVIKALVAVD